MQAYRDNPDLQLACEHGVEDAAQSKHVLRRPMHTLGQAHVHLRRGEHFIICRLVAVGPLPTAHAKVGQLGCALALRHKEISGSHVTMSDARCRAEQSTASGWRCPVQRGTHGHVAVGDACCRAAEQWRLIALVLLECREWHHTYQLLQG